MKIRDIELLHLLFGTGTVSGAARRLHMSQPNASKMLKRIEEELGFALFERIGGRLHATREARDLLEQAERTLHSVQQFERLARDIRDMRGGRLTIGSLPLLSRNWLPGVLGDFLNRYPEVAASFHTRSSQKLIEWIAEGQLDLALTMLELDDPMIDSDILTSVEMAVAMPREHPLAACEWIGPEQLHGVDYVSLGVTDHAREALDRLFRERRATPRERAECALPAVAIKLAECGVGVTLIDHLTAAEYRREQLVFRPFRPRTSMDIWLLRPRLRPNSRLTDGFVRHLRECVERDALGQPPEQLFAP